MLGDEPAHPLDFDFEELLLSSQISDGPTRETVRNLPAQVVQLSDQKQLVFGPGESDVEKLGGRSTVVLYEGSGSERLAVHEVDDHDVSLFALVAVDGVALHSLSQLLAK